MGEKVLDCLKKQKTLYREGEPKIVTSAMVAENKNKTMYQSEIYSNAIEAMKDGTRDLGVNIGNMGTVLLENDLVGELRSGDASARPSWKQIE